MTSSRCKLLLFIALLLNGSLRAQEATPVVHWVLQTPDVVRWDSAYAPNFKGVFIRERHSDELYTLLPIVFFDSGSAVVPSRYTLFSTAVDAEGFQEDTLTSTLSTYYNVLNVVGERLAKQPGTTISLRGITSNESHEPAELSQARAEQIRKYFTSIWDIDPERITIEVSPSETKAMASRASERLSHDRIEESRRVEILSNSWNIVQPMTHEEFIRMPDPRYASFHWQNGFSPEAISKRTLRIRYQGKLWTEISNLGPDSSTFFNYFNWRSIRDNKLPKGEGKMDVQLIVTDTGGREVRSNVDEIDVRRDFRVTVIEEHSYDKTREMYNLLLFNYCKPAITQSDDRILDEYVLNRIRPNSDVVVLGHADRSEPNPAGLSIKRARTVKNVISSKLKGKMKSISSKGYGYIEPLYPDDLPEGRCLNRTVQVDIETPIEFKK